MIDKLVGNHLGIHLFIMPIPFHMNKIQLLTNLYYLSCLILLN